MHQPIEHPDLLEADLTATARHARRQQRIVKRFTDDDPTPWDLAHEWINELLGEWEARR